MGPTTLGQRRGAFATPWPYLVIALLSALSTPLTFGLTLFLGVTVGVIGSIRGALSKDERGRIQGVRILLLGLALLVGPLTYLILALAS
jgi:hypothetical protein